MNSKPIANALICLSLVGAGGWWWMNERSANTTPTKQAAEALTRTSVPMSESPIIASVEEHVTVTIDPAQLQAVASAVVELQRQAAPDPQSQLDTTIPFVSRVLESGDALAILKLTVPPEAITPETQARYQALPPDSAQRQIQLKLISLLDAIGEATPIYSEAGDRVTYQFPTGTTINFRKIDGRWYAAGTGGTGLGNK